MPIFPLNVPLVSLNFLEEISSPSHSTVFLYQLLSFYCFPVSIPKQVDKKSRVSEEERGVWSSQGRDRGLELSRRRKGQIFFSSTFLSLSHIKYFSV